MARHFMLLGVHMAWSSAALILAAQDKQVHYNDVIMTTIASQITSLTIVYSTVYSGADLRKHQSSASLAFMRGIHRGPVNSPHKWPVTRKMFPFDDVIMHCLLCGGTYTTSTISVLGYDISYKHIFHISLNIFSKICFKVIWCDIHQTQSRSLF